MADLRQARSEMVAHQILERGVRSQAVARAMREVPREAFIGSEMHEFAYADSPLPIGEGQTISQPYIVAYMTEALELEGGERVLEVGTGYGFQTALLARLAAEVVSVERFADVAETAGRNLERHGAPNVEVLVGDGSAGAPERAPFDAVVVSAAFTSVPEPLGDQLALGGRLVQPIGPGGREDVQLFEKRSGTLARRRSVTSAYFVPLYGSHGFAP
jgi:protein-L-isoaspartate(D-aspartate) O-methyltransferase